MKRLALVLAVLLFVSGGLWAQTIEDFTASFEDFAAGVANSLPVTASVGLNWSPAYIGQFPHFGVGVSAGGMFLPYDTMDEVISALGINEADIPQQLKDYGIPFPSVAADARLGGFGFPFDIGFKFGMIPEQAKDLLSDNVSVDYLLIGGDVRVPLIQGKGLVPTLSVGGGYTYLVGTIGLANVVPGQVIDISAPMNSEGYAGAHTLTITDADLAFDWSSHVFQGKAQASWNLWLLTPHIGVGAAYGISTAGGGVYSSVLYTGGADLPTAQSVLESFGYAVPTSDGLEVLSDANGWSFWVYGGTAINIFFIKVDLSAMYNLANQDYGASVNVRLQL